MRFYAVCRPRPKRPPRTHRGSFFSCLPVWKDVRCLDGMDRFEDWWGLVGDVWWFASFVSGGIVFGLVCSLGVRWVGFLSDVLNRWWISNFRCDLRKMYVCCSFEFMCVNIGLVVIEISLDKSVFAYLFIWNHNMKIYFYGFLYKIIGKFIVFRNNFEEIKNFSMNFTLIYILKSNFQYHLENL